MRPLNTKFKIISLKRMFSSRNDFKRYVANPRASNDWSKDKTKFGQRMLEKMGWKEGQGIGVNNHGITENIKLRLKVDTKGLGYKIMDDQKWIEIEDNFNNLLSKLKVPDVSSHIEISNCSPKSLESRSQQSKARLHYKKFTRGKDLSRYKMEDLSCIFGFTKKPEQTTKIEENNITYGGNMKEYFLKKIDGKVRGSEINHEDIELIKDENDINDKNESNKKKRFKSKRLKTVAENIDSCFNDLENEVTNSNYIDHIACDSNTNDFNNVLEDMKQTDQHAYKIRKTIKNLVAGDKLKKNKNKFEEKTQSLINDNNDLYDYNKNESNKKKRSKRKRLKIDAENADSFIDVSENELADTSCTNNQESESNMNDFNNKLKEIKQMEKRAGKIKKTVENLVADDELKKNNKKFIQNFEENTQLLINDNDLFDFNKNENNIKKRSKRKRLKIDAENADSFIDVSENELADTSCTNNQESESNMNDFNNKLKEIKQMEKHAGKIKKTVENLVADDELKKNNKKFIQNFEENTQLLINDNDLFDFNKNGNNIKKRSKSKRLKIAAGSADNLMDVSENELANIGCINHLDTEFSTNDYNNKVEEIKQIEKCADEIKKTVKNLVAGDEFKKYNEKFIQNFEENTQLLINDNNDFFDLNKNENNKKKRSKSKRLKIATENADSLMDVSENELANTSCINRIDSESSTNDYNKLEEIKQMEKYGNKIKKTVKNLVAGDKLKKNNENFIKNFEEKTQSLLQYYASKPKVKKTPIIDESDKSDYQNHSPRWARYLLKIEQRQRRELILKSIKEDTISHEFKGSNLHEIKGYGM